MNDPSSRFDDEDSGEVVHRSSASPEEKPEREIIIDGDIARHTTPIL